MTTRSSKMYGSASHRVTEGGVSTRVEEDLNTLLVTVGNLVGGGRIKSVFFKHEFNIVDMHAAKRLLFCENRENLSNCLP